MDSDLSNVHDLPPIDTEDTENHSVDPRDDVISQTDIKLTDNSEVSSGNDAAVARNEKTIEDQDAAEDDHGNYYHLQ